jgi:hypothetical protein
MNFDDIKDELNNPNFKITLRTIKGLNYTKKTN